MGKTIDSSKIRVLVVDDSRLIRIAAAKMFGDDFDVLLAVDGADAWDIIQRDHDIQVVFTDLVMPEMDGFELLQEIRTSKDQVIASLPVIVATGADNPEVAKQKALGLGATDFITKPFNAMDIKARARSYAQFRSVNRQLQEQSTLDVLTGLLNTKGLRHQLTKELSFVDRHRSSITVMAVEIDAFKDLFIRIGRGGAESVIKKVSKVLQDTVRKEDSVARTGVASFMVSMPLASGQNGLELADRICRTVESFRARLDGKLLKITVSVGVCSLEAGTSGTLEAILDCASGALQHATRLGCSQLYQMSLNDYHEQLADEARHHLSIDALLDKIREGDVQAVMPYLDIALERLAPLMTVLSNEQKQRAISIH